MARYQIILAYDGSLFQGFQRLESGPSVQGALETALRSIGWQGEKILAAGRTDSGVHASGQVIAFDLDWRHSATKLKQALNANLPVEIACRAVQTVPDDFHPRYWASSRRYRYKIICDDTRNPLVERYAWRIWPRPEWQTLQDTAAMLTGVHDFAAFGRPPKEGGSTVRKIFACHWEQQGNDLTFDVEGNAFLYHMVRRMVSLQIEIGQGRKALQTLQDHLRNPQGSKVQGMAPAYGLTLVEVKYAEGWPEGENGRLEFMSKDDEAA